MKGVLFSLILIVTMFSLITFIAIQQGLVYSNSGRLAVGTRVNSMLDFYNSVLYDGGKALDIITKRAISSATNHVISTGVGLQSANATIMELVTNGTLDGVPQGLMQSSTIADWVNKMVSLGASQNLNVSLNLTNVQVKPYDSWDILVSADVYVNMSDNRGVANLTKNATISQMVDIENFEDPVYPLYTFGKATNLFVRSPYIENYTTNLVSGSVGSNWFHGLAVIYSSSQSSAISSVPNKNQDVLVTDNASSIASLANQFGSVVSQSSTISGITVPYVYNASNAMSVIPNNTQVLVDGSGGRVWYIENLINDSANSYYHSSPTGGSFLDRLEDSLTVQSKYASQTSNTIGLESFVNKTELQSLGLSVSTTNSNIDYLYFSNNTYPTYQVRGMDTSFRIDKQTGLNNLTHDVVYNVTQILV